MAQAGYVCSQRPACIDETPLPDETPEALVERLACEKARAVACDAPANELIVAADTVVWLNGDILGKPADAEEAEAMLTELSGATHHVSTGCCVMLKDGRGRLRQTSFVDTTEVEFYELEPRELSAYAHSAEPLDKAGAYAIQGQGRLFVKGIVGNYDTVVGLPVARLSRQIRAFVQGL